MSQILTDRATIHVILVVIGFIGAAWTAGHVATNGEA